MAPDGSRPSHPPFVGRGPEFAVLTSCFHRSLTGEPQLVLVQGEAGIGKTRFLKEFAEIAARRGAIVAFARCHERLHAPFLPFADSLFAQLEALPGWDADAWKRIAQAIPSDEEAAGHLDFFLSVSRATIRLAQSQPLVLIVDDLQWADRASLDLLAYVVFSAADALRAEKVPILIAASHRRPEPASALARTVLRFHREEMCTRLDLGRLGLIEIDAIVRSILQRRPSADVVEEIYRASRGNPFLTIELIRTNGGGPPVEEERRGPGGPGVPELRLPSELADPVLVRFQTLPAECQRVLTLASAVGLRFSVDLLEAITGLAEDAILAALDEAQREHLVLRDGDHLEFEHPLVRAAIYRSCSANQRRRIHAEIAARLEAYWGDAAEDHATDIAYHLIQAGPGADGPKLLNYGRKAGDLARAAMSWTDAGRFYAAVLGLDEAQSLAPIELADLHFWRGYVLHRDADTSAALQEYEQAIACYRESGDKGRLGRALAAKLNAQIQGGLQITDAEVMPLENLLATSLDDDVVACRLSNQISEAYLIAGRRDLAVERAKRAYEFAERAGYKSGSMYAQVTLGRLAYQALDVNAAWTHYQKALEIAPEVENRRERSYPIQRAPMALLALGHLDEAVSIAAQGVQLARDTGSYGGGALCLGVQACIAVLRGDFPAAERLAREALVFIDRSGYQWATPIVTSALASSRYLTGATAEALDVLEVGRAAGGGRMLKALVAAHAGAGAPTHASEDGQAPPLWRADIDHLPVFCAAVEVAALQGRLRPDPEGFEALRAVARGGVTFTVGLPFLLQRLLGLLAAANGQGAVAAEHFQSAIKIASSTGAKMELARSYLDFAQTLARAPETRRGEAISLLEQALPLLKELGMRRMLLLAGELAADLGWRVAEAVENSAQSLTYHEAAILEQRQKGRAASAIATDLVLSPRTVRSALRGLESRTVAARAVAEKGGIDLRAVAPDRRQGMAVILFTDIVDSVELTERLGDHAYHDLIEGLHQSLRADIEDNGGLLASGVLLGDGLLATFASASQAIAAALKVRRTAQEHRVPLHIGLHAGDVIWEGDRIAGGAVNVAARICDICPPGEILTSTAIRELALTSSGVLFEDTGDHRLKGLAEPRRLYAVRVPAAKAPEYPDRLSEREVEVLRLLAQGKSNQEIAEHLVISINTVLRHVSNIFAKTGAANRTEATSYAYRHNIAG